MRRLALLLALIFLPLAGFPSQPILLTGMHIKPGPHSTQVIFYLNKKTMGRVKYLPNPDRIVIDFANTRQHFKLQPIRLQNSNIKTISSLETLNGGLRFVFSIRGKARWDLYSLPNEKGLVMQIELVSAANLAAQKALTIEIAKALSQLAEKANQKIIAEDKLAAQHLAGRPATTEKKTTEKKKHVYIIVIDPGHGGRDGGAHGQRGTKEKTIVLSIAKKLANEINHQDNMRVVLTRTGDYFVPLRERIKLARKGNADLFVAIHADAYFDHNAMGASIYALSKRGASSEAARWLAKRENYSELGEVALDSLKDRSPMLRSVLIDLAQTTTVRDSLRLGNKVLDALDKVSLLHHSYVEQAPFVVLKSPDIPSILVETGFITNPKEEKRLADPVYQEKIAKALATGIREYVMKYAVWDE